MGDMEIGFKILLTIFSIGGIADFLLSLFKSRQNSSPLCVHKISIAFMFK